MAVIRYLHHPTTLFRRADNIISLLIVLFLIALPLVSLRLVGQIGLPREAFLVVPMAVMICIFIVIQPKLGILLVAIFAPLDLLQRLPGTTFNVAKVIALLTLIVVAVPILLKRRKLELTRLDKPMLLFIALYTFSLWKIVHLEKFDTMIVTVSYMLLYLMIVNLVETRRFMLILMVVLCIMAFLLSCLAVAQFITGKTIVPIRSSGALFKSYITDRYRALITSDNPNTGAGFLVLILSLVLGLFFIASHRIFKLLLLFVSVTIISGILVTQSRSALLGLIAMILCLTVFLKVGIKPLLFILFICLITYIGVYYLMPEYGILGKSIMPKEGDLSVTNRILLAKASINMIIDNPIWGVGIGNIKYEIPRYGMYYESASHNIFLHVAGEAGLPALIALIWLIVRFIIIMIRSAKVTGDNKLRILSYSFLAGFIGYMVHAQFHTYLWNNLLWYFIGLGLSCAKLAHKRSMPQGHPVSGTKH